MKAPSGTLKEKNFNVGVAVFMVFNVINVFARLLERLKAPGRFYLTKAM